MSETKIVTALSSGGWFPAHPLEYQLASASQEIYFLRMENERLNSQVSELVCRNGGGKNGGRFRNQKEASRKRAEQEASRKCAEQERDAAIEKVKLLDSARRDLARRADAFRRQRDECLESKQAEAAAHDAEKAELLQRVRATEAELDAERSQLLDRVRAAEAELADARVTIEHLRRREADLASQFEDAKTRADEARRELEQNANEAKSRAERAERDLKAAREERRRCEAGLNERLRDAMREAEDARAMLESARIEDRSSQQDVPRRNRDPPRRSRRKAGRSACETRDEEGDGDGDEKHQDVAVMTPGQETADRGIAGGGVGGVGGGRTAVVVEQKPPRKPVFVEQKPPPNGSRNASRRKIRKDAKNDIMNKEELLNHIMNARHDDRVDPERVSRLINARSALTRRSAVNGCGGDEEPIVIPWDDDDPDNDDGVGIEASWAWLKRPTLRTSKHNLVIGALACMAVLLEGSTSVQKSEMERVAVKVLPERPTVWEWNACVRDVQSLETTLEAGSIVLSTVLAAMCLPTDNVRLLLALFRLAHAVAVDRDPSGRFAFVLRDRMIDTLSAYRHPHRLLELYSSTPMCCLFRVDNAHQLLYKVAHMTISSQEQADIVSVLRKVMPLRGMEAAFVDGTTTTTTTTKTSSAEP